MATAQAARAQPPAVGWRGLCLLVAGAALVVLAYVELDWYGVSLSSGTADAAPQATFDNLRASIDQFGGARAATLYFDWLGWTLLGLVIVAGTIGNLKGRYTDLARVVGFVLGIAGALATYYALLQYADAQADAGAARHNPLYNASWGLMAVLAGFVLAALGAVRGPRRRARAERETTA